MSFDVTKINPLLAQGRIIAFHRAYVDLTGSVTAALMLSQALYWQGICTAEDGYWWKTHIEWTEELGMRRDAIDTARKACARWLHVDVRGVPARMFWHLDADLLLEDLSKLACDRKLVCGNPANCDAGIPQASLRDSRKLIKEAEITTEITAKKTTHAPENSGGCVVSLPSAQTPTAEGQMAKALRGAKVDITSAHPDLLRWCAEGVTVEFAMECVEIARQSKPGRIPAKYLGAIIDGERARARESPTVQQNRTGTRRNHKPARNSHEPTTSDSGATDAPPIFKMPDISELRGVRGAGGKRLPSGTASGEG